MKAGKFALHAKWKPFPDAREMPIPGNFAYLEKGLGWKCKGNIVCTPHRSWVRLGLTSHSGNGRHTWGLCLALNKSPTSVRREVVTTKVQDLFLTRVNTTDGEQDRTCSRVRVNNDRGNVFKRQRDSNAWSSRTPSVTLGAWTDTTHPSIKRQW